jgi:hypothetical protein
MLTESSLIEKICELTTKQWEENKRPILLSGLGAELIGQGLDYKQLLYGGKLLPFVERIDRVSITRHPHKPLMVGIIPNGQEYSFLATSVEHNSDSGSDMDQDLKNSRGAFYTFIRELAKLPPELTREINIPVNVIIRLLEKK